MDPRDLVRSNGYLGPGLGSGDQVYLNLVPGTNWVYFQPPSVVTLDPLVDVGTTPPEGGVGVRPELLERRFRSKLMAELMGDFAAMHDELLSDLAR
jgi:hypothetical protein